MFTNIQPIEPLKSQADAVDNVFVKHYLQTVGLCGPASLKILLSNFGKTYKEEELAKLAGATIDQGTEHEGMISSVKQLDGFVFVKDNGTIEELEYFVKKERLPVIIGWFDDEEDHYSVVVNTTDKNIIICDPQKMKPRDGLTVWCFRGSGSTSLEKKTRLFHGDGIWSLHFKRGGLI